MKVRFGIVVEAMHHLPIWVALQHGLYRQRDVDVELSVLGGIDEVTNSLKSGRIDICVGAPEHIIHDVERAGSLRIVAGNVSRPTHYLIVQPEIGSLQELKGKTLGVSGLTGGTSSLFVDVLEQVGLHQNDYTMVSAGVVPPRHAALQRREIDAAMQTDPHNYIAEDSGFRNLGPVAQWIPYVMFSSFNASLSWAEPNADALTRVLAATIDASQWMYRNRSESADLASEWMCVERKYSERAFDDMVGLQALPADLHVTRASLLKTMALMQRDRAIELRDGTVPEKYVALDYLNHAQELAGVPIIPMI